MSDNAPDMPPTSTRPGGASTRPSARGWPMHWSAWIFSLALLVPGIVNLVATALRTTDFELVGDVGGALVAYSIFLGIIYLLSWGAYILFRRSRLAANLTFCILCSLLLLFTIMSLNRLREVKARGEATARFRQQEAELQERLRRQFEQNEIDAGVQEQAAQALDEFAGQLKGEAAQEARGSARLLRQMRVTTEAFDQAIDNFAAMGGYNERHITSLADIDERIAAVETLIEASARLRGQFANLEQMAFDAYRQEGMPAERARHYAALTVKGAHADVLVPLRQADENCQHAGRDLLLLLREQWPLWGCEPDRELAVFPDPDVQDDYYELVDEMAFWEAEMTSMQNEYARRKGWSPPASDPVDASTADPG